MIFSRIQDNSNPGRDEIKAFVDGTSQFLNSIINDNEYGHLWNGKEHLRELAADTYKMDIIPAVEELKTAVGKVDNQKLIDHGLLGRPMHFKLSVVAHILGLRPSSLFGSPIRDWIKRLIDAIDAVLDSIIDATGVGAILKELKDALRALLDEEDD